MATAEGSGQCVSESGDHKGNEHSMVMPATIIPDQKNIDSDSGSFEKKVIVEKAIEIPSTVDSIKSLSKSDIMQHLQEKYKVEASSLLDNLYEHPTDFSYDANGIVSIFGTAYPGEISLKIGIYRDGPGKIPSLYFLLLVHLFQKFYCVT